MQDTIEKIQALIDENEAIKDPKQRTPYLDVALGGLRAALANMQQHIRATSKPA